MNKIIKSIIVSSFLLTGTISFTTELENLSSPTKAALELIEKH